MCRLAYWCRTCSRYVPHKIESFDEEKPRMNFAKLRCTECQTDPFVVQYPKEATAPTKLSQRISEVIGNDEQPSDNYEHHRMPPPFFMT